MPKADKAQSFAGSCKRVMCGENCEEGCSELMVQGTNAKELKE